MYMLAYKALEDCYNIDKDEEDSKPVLPSNAKYNHTLIEKCVSLFKRRRTHCNVIDFDSKYLSDANLKNLISKVCKPEVKTEWERDKNWLGNIYFRGKKIVQTAHK